MFKIEKHANMEKRYRNKIIIIIITTCQPLHHDIMYWSGDSHDDNQSWTC